MPTSPHRPFTLLTPSLLALLLLAASAQAETFPSSPLDPRLDSFRGTWERVAIEEDDGDRMSAIDGALEGLSWLTRQMAAPILRATTAPASRYEFVIREPELLLGQRGEEPTPLPLDGREYAGSGPRGEFTAQSKLVDGVIQTEWNFPDAHGSNRYTISEDGGTLVVEHTILVTGLAGVGELKYRTRFQRTPAVASAGPIDAP